MNHLRPSSNGLLTRFRALKLPQANPKPVAQEYAMTLTPELHRESTHDVFKAAMHIVHPTGRTQCRVGTMPRCRPRGSGQINGMLL